jgi:hypothetical protein
MCQPPRLKILLILIIYIIWSRHFMDLLLSFVSMDLCHVQPKLP